MMLKTAITFLSILCLFFRCSKSKPSNPEYHYSIDLNKIKDGQLVVELNFTGNLTDTSYFYLPKIVPGIYDALDYGKFIDHFTAVDNQGNPLKVNRMDNNGWEIIGTKKLALISYTVSNGWDRFDFEDLRPYRSSESHFDSSVAILNANSVFGYFVNQEQVPFKIQVKKPEAFYGATSLSKIKSSINEDHYFASDYRTLVGNPIMYSEPDTITIKLPNISVQVASYSSSHKKMAGQIAQYITPLVKNQTEYLGGELATDTYTFIIYHNENLENSNHFADGLEHNQSTLVLMYAPLDMEIIKSNIFNLASHEFFHTKIPLGLHSHEIANFNFNHPKFSKHLWLYEGMTEYFTMHMQIKQNMNTLEEFLNAIESKISGMKTFNPSLSFTEMSRNVLEWPDEYMNVYYKGALINLCLDIQLREISNGAYGVQNLVSDLTNRYGKDKPFHDEDLFNDIYEITRSSDIKLFIEKYINGTEELPLKEMLLKVGFDLDSETGKITEIIPITESQRALRKHWINQ